jgi:hypothetical protein
MRSTISLVRSGVYSRECIGFSIIGSDPHVANPEGGFVTTRGSEAALSGDMGSSAAAVH